VLVSETLLASRWLGVKRQRVRTASGYEIDEYYTLDAPDIVVVLALTASREAVLVRQYRHGVGQTVLELPAGMLEDGEDPREAIARELLEETGYQAASILTLSMAHPSTTRQSNRSHCYLALDCREVAEPAGDPGEDIEVCLLPLEELRAAVRRGEFPSQTSLTCLFLGLERLAELTGE
jgi:8-oxo-dGTP pyrophosphatase MutT (NUDIX family)